MENKKIIPTTFRNTCEDDESELFALLFLLDVQQYVYYDNDDDNDILMLENHLKSKNIEFEKGQRNRKYLTINVKTEQTYGEFMRSNPPIN